MGDKGVDVVRLWGGGECVLVFIVEVGAAGEVCACVVGGEVWMGEGAGKGGEGGWVTRGE